MENKSSNGVQELCRVGVALSSEKDIDKLLEMIVSVARHFTNAEGCTLYFCNEEKGCLDFAVVQNQYLEIDNTGNTKQNEWSSIPLFNKDGSENHSNVSAHCALVGKNIIIGDVYNEEGYDFSNTRKFDKASGYRSRSMLLVPMLDNQDDVIGVLQLLNARSADGNEQCGFNDNAAEIIKGLASQASVAMVNVRLINRIKKYTRLGVALSAEKDIQTLLQMIAEMARKYTYAEGCTVYLCNEDQNALQFAVVQNKKLNIDSKVIGDGKWPEINLYHEDGQENHSNASAYCALKNKTINISDVYDEEGFDFSGTRKFDGLFNFRSQSMLLIPMTDHEDEVVGVLQLLNARKGITRKVCPFLEEDIPMVRGLASQAAVAVNNVRLVQNMEDLLKSFIKSIAAAIDEKSPYTGHHIQRVATLTDMLIDKINRADSGYFAKTHFSEDQADEISIAAWMHDMGKIATPEYIIDKATKLETVYDRIEVVRLRVELMKREREIELLRKKCSDSAYPKDQIADIDNTDLDETLRFLANINKGSEFTTEEDLVRLEEVASTMSYNLGGQSFPLLNRNEVDCCSIRRGTLTEEERLLINHHVDVSIMMLEQLPFPRKWKSVPEYAGMHHEKLDGSGYPKGNNKDEISLPARILAVADVFEALTAADRPYKVGKKLSEAMRIIKFMSDDEHLDENLCDLLAQSGIIKEYSGKYLEGKQITKYSWKGEEF